MKTNEFIADGKKYRLKIKLNFSDDSRRLLVRTRADYFAGAKPGILKQNSDTAEWLAWLEQQF